MKLCQRLIAAMWLLFLTGCVSNGSLYAAGTATIVEDGRAKTLPVLHMVYNDGLWTISSTVLTDVVPHEQGTDGVRKVLQGRPLWRDVNRLTNIAEWIADGPRRQASIVYVIGNHPKFIIAAASESWTPGTSWLRLVEPDVASNEVDSIIWVDSTAIPWEKADRGATSMPPPPPVHSVRLSHPKSLREVIEQAPWLESEPPISALVGGGVQYETTVEEGRKRNDE